VVFFEIGVATQIVYAEGIQVESQVEQSETLQNSRALCRWG